MTQVKFTQYYPKNFSFGCLTWMDLIEGTLYLALVVCPTVTWTLVSVLTGPSN